MQETQQGRKAITKGKKMHKKNLTAAQLDKIIRGYAAEIESEWAGGIAPTPSPERKTLSSAAAMGVDVNEFEYAAAVRFLLEDRGTRRQFSGARNAVLRNRQSLTEARDNGTEPNAMADAFLAHFG